MKELHYGLTEVREDENTLEISHNGNMGNSIVRSVNPNLKELGYGSIASLKQLYKEYKEEGGPDYSYYIVFNKKK